MTIEAPQNQTGRDTRRRISEHALELFARNGYDATSMREIAEAAGVTKASLYYHFKSKADIVISLMESYRLQLEDLVRWATRDPRPTPREILHAIAESVRSQGVEVFRFLLTNRQVLRDLPLEETHRYDIPESLYEALAYPETSLEWRIRAQIAVQSLHSSLLVTQELGASEAEILATTLVISEEILRIGPVTQQ